MRVLLAGVVNWIASFTEGCSRALTALGIEHDVAPLADYAFRYDRSLLGKLRRRLPWTQKAHFQEYSAFIARFLERAGSAYDIVFIAGGQHLSHATLVQLRAQCDRTGAKIAIWFFDDPIMHWSPPRARVDLLESSRCFDYTFVFDSYYLPLLGAWGFGHPSLLPLATDSDVFGNVAATPEEKKRYTADVSFVGAGHPRRDTVLLGLTNFDLALYGSVGANNEQLRRFVRAPIVPLRTSALIYHHSKVVLNVNHPHSIHGSNLRTYDAPLAGAVCVTDRKLDLEAQFVDGEEIVMFDDPGEVPTLVASLLRDEDRRLSIARRGRQRVLAEHTLVHRMRRAIEVMTR